MKEIKRKLNLLTKHLLNIKHLFLLWALSVLGFIAVFALATNFFNSTVQETSFGNSKLFPILFIGSMILGLLSFGLALLILFIKFLKSKRVHWIAKIVIVVGLLAVISRGAYFFVFSQKKTEEESTMSNKVSSDLYDEAKMVDMMVDIDGDGKKDFVEILVNKACGMNTTLNAYNQKRDLIASLHSDISILKPIDGSLKIYKLRSDKSNESFSLDFIKGPHQTDRMFFELIEGKIIPLCFKAEIMGPRDCLFYSANPGGIVVDDLDNDGFAELIEYADEYPTDVTLNEEEKSAILESLDEIDVSGFTEGAERIAIREKGGRGRTAVWAIYSYAGYYFEPQVEDLYEKYFSILENSNPGIIRKSELSNESLDYNEFVKEFWN